MSLTIVTNRTGFFYVYQLKYSYAKKCFKYRMNTLIQFHSKNKRV